MLRLPCWMKSTCSLRSFYGISIREYRRKNLYFSYGKPFAMFSTLYTGKAEKQSYSPLEPLERLNSLKLDNISNPNEQVWLKKLQTHVKAKQFKEINLLLSDKESTSFDKPSSSFGDQFFHSYTNIICDLIQRGEISSALSLFEKVNSTNEPEMWNIITNQFVKVKKGLPALSLWHLMISKGAKPDKNTAIAALSAVSLLKNSSKVEEIMKDIKKQRIRGDIELYNQLLCTHFACGDTNLALSLFQQLKSTNLVDSDTWGITMKGLAKHPSQVLALWDQLISSDTKPDEITSIAVIKATLSLNDEKDSFRIYKVIKKQNLPTSIALNNQILCFLLKYGKFSSALDLFDKMRASNQINMETWQYTIVGLAPQREAEALSLLEEMVKTTYNVKHTLLKVLNGCKETKQSSLAMTLFDTMESKYNTKQTHIHLKSLLVTLYICRMDTESNEYKRKYISLKD